MHFLFCAPGNAPAVELLDSLAELAQKHVSKACMIVLKAARKREKP